jgi:membrane protease YdiL (CAAX protease family)
VQLDPDPPGPAAADARAPLPFSAVGWALVGVLVGVVASGVLTLLASVVSDSLALELLVAQGGLYAGIGWGIVFVCRRYRTGRVRDDLVVSWRRVDVGIGVIGSIACRIAAGVLVVVVLTVLDGDADDATPEQFERFETSDLARVVVALIAVLAAPVVEELLFRGVLLRGLRGPLGRDGAIAVQAAAFGLLHVDWSGPWEQGVTLFVATAALGVGSAVLVELTGRLAPSIWAHAAFNLVSAIVILAGI